MAGRRARVLVVPLALALALGFGGLPPTGGALAKAAVKDEFGAGIAAWCAAMSAFGSTMLMLHFVSRVWIAAQDAPSAPVGRGLLIPWIGLAVAALLVPWPVAAALVGDAAAKIWSPASLMPVLAGIALSFAWRRWGERLPAIPEGDIVVLMRRGAGPRLAAEGFIVRFERLFLSWPTAGLALLVIVLALLAVMVAASR
jgi:hypothetical protein